MHTNPHVIYLESGCRLPKEKGERVKGENNQQHLASHCGARVKENTTTT